MQRRLSDGRSTSNVRHDGERRDRLESGGELERRAGRVSVRTCLGFGLVLGLLWFSSLLVSPFHEVVERAGQAHNPTHLLTEAAIDGFATIPIIINGVSKTVVIAQAHHYEDSLALLLNSLKVALRLITHFHDISRITFTWRHLRIRIFQVIKIGLQLPTIWPMCSRYVDQRFGISCQAVYCCFREAT